MSGKNVLIVSSNGLFREGLKHILADRIDLVGSTQVSSLREAADLVQLGQFDVVICVLSDTGNGSECCTDKVSSLLTRPGVRLLIVSLKTGDISVFKRERILEASDEDLVSALAD